MYEVVEGLFSVVFFFIIEGKYPLTGFFTPDQFSYMIFTCLNTRCSYGEFITITTRRDFPIGSIFIIGILFSNTGDV